MQDPSVSPSGTVFQFAIAPAPRVDDADLERHILEKAARFCLSQRPHVSPADLTHRVLRIEGDRSKGDRYLWEITFEGVDLPGDEPSDRTLAADLVDEVRAQLDTIGLIVASKKLVDISPIGLGSKRIPGAPLIPAFTEESPYNDRSGWEEHSPVAAGELAGKALTADLLAAIKAAREGIPSEPGLKPHQGGYVYSGGSDKTHVAFVKEHLSARAAAASPADKRRVLAFLALQGREGSTTAINTYDSQIVTWGTGGGGRGGLGRVMQLAVQNDAVRRLFYDCGFRYLGRQAYDVVDVPAKKVISGTTAALYVVRSSTQLLTMLIHCGRGASTRSAVLEAQLAAFVEGSGNITGADMIATQALFNLMTHLKHWAPAYVVGALEAVAPLVPSGPPSVERDKLIAPLVGRYFYGKARKTKWIPSFGQFKLCWAHMRDDGLDCMDDPFIKASAPPTEGPFTSTSSGPSSVRG